MTRRFPIALFAPLLLVVLTAWHAVANGGDPAENDARVRVQRMYEDYRAESFPNVFEVSADRAAAFADSADALWLDVRTARERKVSVIEGAVDQRTFDQHREAWAGRPVIVYCTVGYRSGLATRELREEGIEAYNLAGGVLAWIHAAGTLVDGRSGDATQRVHVYGRRWNLVPEGWKAVW